MADNGALREVFKTEAERALAAFPDILEKFMLISTKELIYVSPALAEELTGSVAPVAAALKKCPGARSIIKDRAAYLKRSGAAACAELSCLFDFRLITTLITINEHVPFTPASQKYTRHMYFVGNFNHELGHLIVKNGYPVPYDQASLEENHLAECAAEAFKALRHRQIFGGDTDFLANTNYSHAPVEGISPIHYMDIVSCAVGNLARERDLSSLSFRETVELAGEIALKYHFDAATLTKITDAFCPVGKLTSFSARAKECFKIMMAHRDDPDIYRAGRRYLDHPRISLAIGNSDSFLRAAFRKVFMNGAPSFWAAAFAEMEKF